MNAFAVFAAQFLMVFLLGFQSRCVRDSNYLAANVNSIGLGICGLIVTPAIADPALITNDPATLAGFLLAGPLAISLAIFIHDRTLARRSQH